MEYKTDIEIAQACEKEKITAIAERWRGSPRSISSSTATTRLR